MKIYISILSFFLFFSVFTGTGHGAAFIVNNMGDSKDQTIGDGICADAGGNCTLRAATEESNALVVAGGNSITFAFDNPGVISLTLGALTLGTDLTITGPGARRLTVQRSTAADTPRFGVFSIVRFANSVSPTVTVSISGLMVANGETNGSGAGIRVASNCILNLTEVVVRNNTAVGGSGGGIITNGRLNITRSLISHNTASQAGGISNQPGSETTIENSTVSNNAAVGSPATSVSGIGGGIGNSTRLTLNNVTVSHNSATDINGGISNTTGSTLNLRNSLIAVNTSRLGADTNGPVTSQGNNLIGNNVGVTAIFPAGNPNANGDRVGTADAPLNPRLGNLQNNGGQTDTRGLLQGSPAIDGGNNCVFDRTCPTDNPLSNLIFDQRGSGFPRRLGTNIDIGAFEGQLITFANTGAFDFDGDLRADLSIFRPSNGAWYLQQSTAGFAGVQFGAISDKIAPADYDGDGKTDLAVFRSGIWYIQRSTQGFTGISFGISEDIPMTADYDGDGRADLGVFRPSTGTWYLQQSTAGFTGIQFGQAGDVPVAADYDGDGKADVAVFRSGIWYIQRSQLGFTGINFGLAADLATPADYDGDGKTDVAVFRPSTGTWYQQQSTAGFNGVQFGANGDAPTPADYDGDGKVDLGVFRSGVWYLNRSTQGFTGIQFGQAGDQPTPNAFVR